MLWALKAHDPERWLVPATGDFDAMLALIETSDTAFKPNLDAYKYASRDAPEKGLAARAAGSEFLQQLDQRLASQPVFVR